MRELSRWPRTDSRRRASSALRLSSSGRPKLQLESESPARNAGSARRQRCPCSGLRYSGRNASNVAVAAQAGAAQLPATATAPATPIAPAAMPLACDAKAEQRALLRASLCVEAHQLRALQHVRRGALHAAADALAAVQVLRPQMLQHLAQQEAVQKVQPAAGA
eukprot:358727-Chlamydomonas_euryale.AAC.19